MNQSLTKPLDKDTKDNGNDLIMIKEQKRNSKGA